MCKLIDNMFMTYEHVLFTLVISRIGGVIVSVLASSAVYRGFEPDRVKPKTIKLVFVAPLLSTQHKGKNKDWLDGNQDHVSEWGAMAIRGLLFQ